MLPKLVQDIFKDEEWSVTNEKVENLDQNAGKVVLRRLLKLYPRKNRPAFFPDEEESLFKVKDPNSVPYFLTEINMFPPAHYKSLFVTQDYQENGLYHVIFNKDGRFQSEIVDDLIPVYEETEEPIWGMDLNHPWQLILLKVWAKVSKGYFNVKNGNPFEFIEAFTNSNWKYWNLAREGPAFLHRYTDKLQLGKFILKTKISNEVRASGLVEGSTGYELASLKEITKNKKWIVTIRSTLKNQWTGGLSIVDK